VGFDLDRTIAQYEGWRGELHIGAPVPGMIERIKQYLAQGIEVRVFTARMSDPDPEARLAIARAIWDYTLEHVGQGLHATCQKDYACIRIYDDIARQVIPNAGVVVGESA
jgi:hypothetical protein